MAKSYFSIGKEYKQLISDLSGEKILGFDSASTLDNFCLAVALGISNPQKVLSKESYARTEYLHNDFRSNALLSAVNIARARNDDEVDEFATLDSIIDYTEMLAYSGFGELAEMLGEIKRGEASKQLIEKRLESVLETMYLQNIENDI